MSDICKRCNGTGSMEKCLRCGREYRHIHKYSDCDGPDCDGEAAKTIPCSDCAGTGKQAELAADPLPDDVIAEGLRLHETTCPSHNYWTFIGHAQTYYHVALREVQVLRAEVERLKRGDFTPEEFQNLCHNRHEMPGCTRADFEQGCREYQKQLFGPEEPDHA